MTVHRNKLKQHNRPFKGSSKSKGIKKVKISAKVEFVKLPRKKVAQDSKIAAKQSRLELRRLGPRPLLVVSCTERVNSSQFVREITEYLQNYDSLDKVDADLNLAATCIRSNAQDATDHDCSPGQWVIGSVVKIPKKAMVNSLQQKIYFYSCPRDLTSILTAAAVADIVILLFAGISSDDAFDSKGYDIIRAMKLQGIPQAIGVNLVDSDSAIVKRYFHDELGSYRKYFVLNDVMQLLRGISSVGLKQISWREDRAYMLGQLHSYDRENRHLVLKGYMRNVGFNCRNLVHITDMDDFILERIEVLPASGESSGMSLDKPGPVVVDQFDISEIRDQLEVLNEEEGGGVVEDQRLDEMFENIAIESKDNDALDEYFKQFVKESKNYEMEIRDPKDRMFPDEVDIPSDVLASKRFRKYRALENFNKSEWDPYADLPVQYSRIHEFESFKALVKHHHSQYAKNSREIVQAIKKITKVDTNEPFVYLHIRDVNPHSVEAHLPTKKPFIVSSVFPYERKVSILEMVINRMAPLEPKQSPEDGAESKVLSKSQYDFLVGFRRFPGKPIFSVESSVKSSGKSRYLRELDNATPCLASIYGFALSHPLPVLMMRDGEIVAHGSVAGPNPMRVVLKRIILTGYPIKVHKQKAIVRYMFFNPHDIRWYKPAQLVTKNGLTGKITASLGTHGYMKCLFNQYIAQDDVVMLYLYKRVYPKWHQETWAPRDSTVTIP